MTSLEEPKYLTISREIESQILTGRHEGRKFPSTRDIAEEHGVSVVTASRALQVLRDKGLIGTVGRSRSFLVKEAKSEADPVRPIERYALFLRSTPGPWQLASRSIPVAGFLAAAGELDVQIDYERFDLDDPARSADPARQVAEAAELGVRGLFFMPSRHSDQSTRQDERLIEKCRDAGLPVVLLERNLRSSARPLECDLVANDDLDGGYRSTKHLIDQGRQRIAFVTGSPTSSHDGRIAGYLAALLDSTHRRKPFKDPIVLEQLSGLPTRDAYLDLADRIIGQKIDGVVCYQDYTAVGLIIELLTRRVTVPNDVAITGFDNLPIGNSFALGVTTYEYPARSIARHAIRLMRIRIEDPESPPVKVLVPGRLIVRESSLSQP
ncbi:LacI family DNA-binding transcriptional regulator [Tundrisphaera lichenicola]|uniref:LacI family DNA-binding transcriptional regulator n=1 Tax=Tundrisphaera lichenicola TaxID=2029860 RepID=UPI003EBEF35D